MKIKKYNRAFAAINLDAVSHNLTEMKKTMESAAKIIGVIKADAYGHGAAAIGKELEPLPYIWGYAVATIEEAVSLRINKLKKPILILGTVFYEEFEAIRKYQLTPMVFSYEMAKKLSDTMHAWNQDVKIHIKIDTGMNRLGFPYYDNMVSSSSGEEKLTIEEELTTQEEHSTIKVIEQISRLPHIIIEGIYTHFAMADEADKTMTEKQLAQFNRLNEILVKKGIHIPLRHVSNSAAIIDMKKANLSLVRAGIAMYGIWPSDEVSRENVHLMPALALKGRIVSLKTLKPGMTISYGGTYQTVKEQRIATISVGYADGYPRSLSNKGYVLVRGKKAPICGRICMDQFMVDVTDISAVTISDPVTLIGRDGDEEITVEELSRLSGRFHYEIPCMISKRIPRVYYKNDRIIQAKDYFGE